eukprot:3404151-Rhodomonas_salina.2
MGDLAASRRAVSKTVALGQSARRGAGNKTPSGLVRSLRDADLCESGMWICKTLFGLAKGGCTNDLLLAKSAPGPPPRPVSDLPPQPHQPSLHNAFPERPCSLATLTRPVLARAGWRVRCSAPRCTTAPSSRVSHLPAAPPPAPTASTLSSAPTRSRRWAAATLRGSSGRWWAT